MKLTETVHFESLGEDQIDAEGGVIRGVRILGADSRNGRTYSESARDDAARLYEGIGVNINHPSEADPGRNRDPFLEAFGELRNVRHDKQKAAVYADHHFPTSHSHAQLYLENARRFPTKLGFSHNADGETSQKAGQTIVESLSFVQSVDLVDRPATNAGLFESEKPMKKTTTVREICEADKSHPIAQCLLEMEDPAMLAAPVEVEAGGSMEDGVKAALRAAVMALFDDDSLDAKETGKRIMKLLQAGEKMQNEISGGTSGSDAGDGQASEDAAMESLRQEVATLRESLESKTRQSEAEKSVRSLLESEGRVATDEEFKMLAGLGESDRQVFVSRLPYREDASRPDVSPGILQESTDSLNSKFEEKLKAARAKSA